MLPLKLASAGRCEMSKMRYIKSPTAALRKVGGPAAVVFALVAIEVLAALYGGP